MICSHGAPCSDGGLDSGSRIELDSIHKIWIQMNWIQPVSSEYDLSCIHWFCWESWVWIELGLVKSCNDESELRLNPIYMNPKWIWIHYLPGRIQESPHISRFFAPRRSTWKFRTTHNERSCSRLVLYIYVYCTCITQKSNSLYSQVDVPVLSCIRNVQVFGSQPSKVTSLITN